MSDSLVKQNDWKPLAIGGVVVIAISVVLFFVLHKPKNDDWTDQNIKDLKNDLKTSNISELQMNNIINEIKKAFTHDKLMKAVNEIKQLHDKKEGNVKDLSTDATLLLVIVDKYKENPTPNPMPNDNNKPNPMPIPDDNNKPLPMPPKRRVQETDCNKCFSNDSDCQDESSSREPRCAKYLLNNGNPSKKNDICTELEMLASEGSVCSNCYVKLISDSGCKSDIRHVNQNSCGKQLNEYQQTHPGACKEFLDAYNSGSKINDIDVKNCYINSRDMNIVHFQSNNEKNTIQSCVRECSESTFGVPGCSTLCNVLCNEKMQ